MRSICSQIVCLWWWAVLSLVSLTCGNTFALALSSPMASRIRGKLILAPLTRGGNLPFRRLCGDFGMEASVSEMVYARHLIKGDRLEQARLRRAPNEVYFGVQMATNQIEEGLQAIELARRAGADFVDLNCGCPIYEATRRGLGSALLRSPKKLERLVQGMVEQQQSTVGDGAIPLSVKLRLGSDASSIYVREVVQRLKEAGVAAVTIHGRTAIQGYRKPADWDWIRQVVEDNNGNNMPIIGNGDIFTHYEAHRRIQETGVAAVMVGRGALIKPWIFQEFRDGKLWEPEPEERVAVYRRLACYMKEYFGDDEMGRKKSWYFLPWHLDFFARYVPLPEEDFAELSLQQPLIQVRQQPQSINGDVPPLKLLLSHRGQQAHEHIAAILWDSDSDEDAVTKLKLFAESSTFREIQLQAEKEEARLDDVSDELANIPSSKGGKWYKRRGRNPKPQRTDEEIAAIRAERAAKKVRLALQNETNTVA